MRYKQNHTIPARRPDQVLTNKKRIYHLDNFDVPVDHRVEIKENEKIDKYLDLARELKKLWNEKVMLILRIIGNVIQTSQKKKKKKKKKSLVKTGVTTCIEILI